MEKTKPIVDFSTDNSLFQILNDGYEQECATYNYGAAGIGDLDIYVSLIGSYLKSIDCAYCNNLVEMDMHLEEPEELELKEDQFTHFTPPETEEENFCGSFQIAFTQKEMDIVFAHDKKPTKFSRNGRLEFYSNDENELLYIRVKDLTEEEYQKLLSEKKKNESKVKTVSLKSIEEKEDISIVQASMIGSRGWGYEDKESDIDIRFVFVRDPREYISILQHEDSIAYPIEDKKDIVGYDLGKFLRMICNQNPTAYEILFSPKQERENEFVERIRQFATEVMDPNRMIMIYQNIVKEKLAELTEKKENTTKATIYIIRMLGMIHYLQKNGTFPTCSVEGIFKGEENTPLKQLLEELIKYKRNGEKDLNIHPELIEFLRNDLEKTRGIKVNKEVQDKREIERKANALFHQTVMGVQEKNHQEEMQKVADSEKEIEEEEAVYK